MTKNTIYSAGNSFKIEAFSWPHLHASTAVIKPNWVQESHEKISSEWKSVIAHPDVILSVLDQIKSKNHDWEITVCDAPHTYADFSAILSRGDFIQQIESRRKSGGSPINVLDLRREIWTRRDGVIVERRPNAPDPKGYVRVDLGRDSLFYRHQGEGRYYGADYDVGEVNRHHHGEVHEYLLSGTAIGCDLFVNVPKLKTHKKTGITCALKNLVGINGDKNWLPHHVEGVPSTGGDEFPVLHLKQRMERSAKKLLHRAALSVPGLGTWALRKARLAGMKVMGDSEHVVRNGNWHGNDTTWRMALDLNRALLYANPDGSMREMGQAKPYLCVVDGLIGGEGNGPICPDPVESGVIIVGDSPAEVDAVACRLMGFDPRMVPLVRHAFDPHRWPLASCPLDEVRVFDERVGREIALDEVAPAVPGGFRPHFGWSLLNPAKAARPT